MLALSRRAASLGTENAFVVLAEVNALLRAGRDIVSFCIGQPDFPTPTHIQDAAVAAVRGGKHGYTPSAGIDELRAAAAASMSARITPKTRLLILNTPHNPTGGLLRRADLEAIAQVLQRHPQVWVYADEIYSRLVYDGQFTSIAALPGMQERTIISDGASKTYAMTGWRIGFAANRTLAPVFTRWITNTESCAAQVSQWAAVQALNGPQDEAEAMRARFAARRDLIVRLLNQVPGFSCATPGGAFYAWPNVTEACALVGAADSEELRRRLLHEAGVAVLADIHFGPRVAGDGQHIRFSYATSDAAIEQGVARIAQFVRNNTRPPRN